MHPNLIDTHCHLHFPAYDSDREEVLARMREREVWGITIGTSMENSRAGIVFAEKHEDIWATVGLHPSHCTSDHFDEQEGSITESHVDPEVLKTLALSSKKVVAIGESGLDFYRFEENEAEDAKSGGAGPGSAGEKQEVSFRHHIDVALDLDVPLVIHCREALVRLAEILQEYQTRGNKARGVIHSFTGTWDEAKPFLDLGFHLAVNGIATFPLKKSQSPETSIDSTIERMPLEKLLLETDAPYLAPGSHRGKRNEPAYVEEVARHVAQVRGMSFEETAKHTTENARNLFQI